MTIIEAIQSNPMMGNIPLSFINTVLISRSIDGAVNYTESSLKDVELASADLYFSIATIPEFSEGQLSLKYNSSLLLNRALSIYNKYDDPKADELRPQPINVNVSSVNDI